MYMRFDLFVGILAAKSLAILSYCAWVSFMFAQLLELVICCAVSPVHCVRSALWIDCVKPGAPVKSAAGKTVPVNSVVVSCAAVIPLNDDKFLFFTFAEEKSSVPVKVSVAGQVTESALPVEIACKTCVPVIPVQPDRSPPDILNFEKSAY